MATGTDVPIVDTAIQGWRDAIAAREKMPTLFWVAIVAMIGLGLVHFILAVWLSLPLIGRLALLVVQPLILTPFAIAIHRFVLLGEVRDNFDFAPSEPRFQKFFGYMIALELLGVIPRIIAFLVAALSFFLSSIVWLILAVVAAVIAVRTVILFPAIALDLSGAEWRNAQADAQGHSWSVFLVLVCTFLPAALIAIVVLALFSVSWLLTLLVFALVLPVISVFTTAAAAAAVSRLFAAYADQLGRPSNLSLRAAV